MSASITPPPTARSASRERFSLGPVELRVTDADRAARFWQELVGLAPLGDGDAVALGADGQTLLVLRQTAARPAQPGHSGLYHVAVHFPDARECGRVLGRLASAGWPVSLSDHLFSQAVYLRDPDGIGVELTLETPWRMREMRVDPRRGLHVIDQVGRVRRPSEPLDVAPLLAATRGRDLSAPAEGAFIGHVHLTVPDLGAALAFYRDRLGMVSHLDEPDIGFADLHAGGDFTHRLALNTFSGAGAPPTPVDMAGMDRFTIRYDTPARLEQARSRLQQTEIAAAHIEGREQVRDPAGNAIDLTVG